jgi:hypothetical protein
MLLHAFMIHEKDFDPQLRIPLFKRLQIGDTLTVEVPQVSGV